MRLLVSTKDRYHVDLKGENMNVLEATRLLDKYGEIILALKGGAYHMRSHEDFYKERLLLELVDEYDKKAVSLKDNLEKTSLTVMRG